MGTRIRRGGRRVRGRSFDLRRTAVGFVFLALLVCGAGLAVRAALATAERHPVLAGLSLAALVAGVVALLRVRRGRRAAAEAAAAAVAAAYEVVDAALEEPALEEPAGAGRIDTEGTGPAPEPVRPVDYAAMDPYDFEEAVAALCRRDGCPDAEVVGGAGDLGADVVATTPDGRRLVVQCKRYTDGNKVGSQDLQRFGGTCYAVHGAEAAVVVTTGDFTEPALEYAEQCGIICVALDELTAWSEGAAPPPWYAEATVQPAEG
ncbi:restriction endonuclease [Streptomyces sp. NPDC047737]|uniref:restriction endonuclease n=1 Tax=unclassified Streptomyces TaxID=2593676 RepID=UPI0033FF5D86